MYGLPYHEVWELLLYLLGKQVFSRLVLNLPHHFLNALYHLLHNQKEGEEEHGWMKSAMNINLGELYSQ